jgi:acyl-CoA synthetase (AMP-forming)/AMP-acid ligase II/acyl carrier protein
VQYTSGSTSQPKGVMVSHANLCANLGMISRATGARRGVAGVSWVPFFHDMGLIGSILGTVYTGSRTYILQPWHLLYRPFSWLEAISRYGAEISGGPNFAYDLCVEKIDEERLAQLDLSSWRYAFCGAEPVRYETFERFRKKFGRCGFQRAAFQPCYGLAEATLLVSYTHGGEATTTVIEGEALSQNLVVACEDTSPKARRFMGCGTIDDGRIAIVNPSTLKRLPLGHVGEIWLAGPHIAEGYWSERFQGSPAFNAHTIEGDGPFLRTGDLGFLDGNGILFVVGRWKDLLIVRGRNIHPSDVEATARRVNAAFATQGSAAFQIEMGQKERVVLCQEIAETFVESADIRALGLAIQVAVAEEHDLILDDVQFLKSGAIPRTSSGKIQHGQCSTAYANGSLTFVEARAANTKSETVFERGEDSSRAWTTQGGQLALEREIQEVLTRSLGIAATQITPEKPFLEYGVDSLRAVQATADLEKHFGRPLPPTLIYDYPNVRALARWLGGETGTNREDSSRVGTQALDENAIAIVGIGCRFPEAQGGEEFWEKLLAGYDAIREVRLPGAAAFRKLGSLGRLDHFDAGFFEIAPREAREMDPQHRLLLETAWEALEDAGIPADQLRGTHTGVYV